MASTRMPSSPAVLETRAGLLKRLAEEQAPRGVWDEFLSGDEEDASTFYINVFTTQYFLLHLKSRIQQ
ncbi:hypothetical protein MMC31_001393, partial [Peltigera leucophlebia]|nr:hypothetical protein [Peltigera leucophlebia]